MHAQVAIREDEPRDLAASAPAARVSRLHQALLVLAGLQLIAIYAPTLRWLIDRWTMSVWHNAHGMLIPFAVAYFAHEELRRLPPRGRESSAWGFVFVIPAVAMHALDAGMHTQLLSAASIVVMLPGLALLFFGPTRTRAIAFPLAFLSLMLPIPLALTEPLHLALRQVATAAASAALPLLGVTAYTEGTTIHLAKASLLVGDACSGFSTLYAALAMAALVAYSSPAPWRRVLVLTAAGPIAVLANILRVLLLVLVVHRTGVDVLSTWIHPASGMLTFALSLPVIFWLGGPSRQGRS